MYTGSRKSSSLNATRPHLRTAIRETLRISEHEASALKSHRTQFFAEVKTPSVLLIDGYISMDNRADVTSRPKSRTSALYIYIYDDGGLTFARNCALDISLIVSQLAYTFALA